MATKKETIQIKTVRSAVSRYKWFDSFDKKDEQHIGAVERMKSTIKAYCTSITKESHTKTVVKERFLYGLKQYFSDGDGKKDDVLFALALNDFYIMVAKNFRWTHTHTRDEFWKHFADEEMNKYNAAG